MEIDKETLAYLRQNIENEIKQNLESRLFKLYTIIGAAFLGGVGVIGFPWAVSYIDGKIEAAIQHRVDATEKVTNEVRAAIESARRDVDRALAQIEVKRDTLTKTLDDIQTKSSGAAQQLNLLRGEMQQRSDEMAARLEDVKRKLDDTHEQARAASERLRDAGPDAGIVESTASTLKLVVDQVKQLDLAVKTIAQNTNSPHPNANDEMRATQLSELQRIAGRNVEQMEQAAMTPTVYFQFAALPRESAKAISSQLTAHGWRIPGEERIDSASGLSEIRCFYQVDCDQAAQALRKDMLSALTQLGYDAPPVEVRPLLGYSPKPRQGILEIWFGLGKPSGS
ncbi:hypothetical protein KXR53_28900 [Inquilinus limosus]|uniref:hypothetical protein n=1 Tax=Inquilinus limosus TaxID=171674 RepID=UPI003F1586E3